MPLSSKDLYFCSNLLVQSWIPQCFFVRKRNLKKKKERKEKLLGIRENRKADKETQNTKKCWLGWTETHLHFGNTYCPAREEGCRAGSHHVREHLWRNAPYALLPQANCSFRATYLPWKTFYEDELNTWSSQISHESQQLCAHSDEIKQIFQKGLSSVLLPYICHGLRADLWSSMEIQVAL